MEMEIAVCDILIPGDNGGDEDIHESSGNLSDSLVRQRLVRLSRSDIRVGYYMVWRGYAGLHFLR